jgi:transcriptional regulator with XRE-family HTH domain
MVNKNSLSTLEELLLQKNFGELLKKARKRKKLTAEQLGKEISVDRTYISKIENLNHIPSIKVCLKILSTLGMPLTENQGSDDFGKYILKSVSEGPKGNAYLKDFLCQHIQKNLKDDPRAGRIEILLRKIMLKRHDLTKENINKIIKRFIPEHKNNEKLINEVKKNLKKINKLENESNKLANKASKELKNTIKIILSPPKNLKT